MARTGWEADPLVETVHRLHADLDRAVQRTVDLRAAGASDEVILTETAMAVKAAKALEGLTGVSWDERLEQKAERLSQQRGGRSGERAGRRRWLRRSR